MNHSGEREKGGEEEPQRRCMCVVETLKEEKMRRNKLFVVLAVIMVVSLLAGCAPKEKLATTLNWNLGTEPPTIDPQLATDTTSVDVDAALFLGLTDIDPDTAAVIPELATEWSASADGLVWTFKMRNDAPVQGKPRRNAKLLPMTSSTA